MSSALPPRLWPHPAGGPKVSKLASIHQPKRQAAGSTLDKKQGLLLLTTSEEKSNSFHFDVVKIIFLSNHDMYYGNVAFKHCRILWAFYYKNTCYKILYKSGFNHVLRTFFATYLLQHYFLYITIYFLHQQLFHFWFHLYCHLWVPLTQIILKRSSFALFSRFEE